MRAKRSKKYRKIMSAYNLHFSFRTPYQVLCDSNFLRTCYAFHMPIQTFLENTLHGDSRPYLTQCTLQEITRAHEKKFARSLKNSGGQAGQKGRGDGKPQWLPLPQEVPLRYCKHKDVDGKEEGIVSEVECLFDLLSGQAKGNEVPKNKQHYVLATAESEEDQKRSEGNLKRKRGVDIREQARTVPGVPIVYVKRSVMILEELSASSERVIRGVEKDKFKEGLIGPARTLKRKREADSDGEDGDDVKKQAERKKKSLPRAREPNPLSVKKKKPKAMGTSGQQDQPVSQDLEQTKKKHRRKRGKKGGTGNSENTTETDHDHGIPSAEGQEAISD